MALARSRLNGRLSIRCLSAGVLLSTSKPYFGIEECGFIGFGNHRLIADGPFHIQAENAGKDFLPAVQWGNIDDAAGSS